MDLEENPKSRKLASCQFLQLTLFMEPENIIIVAFLDVFFA